MRIRLILYGVVLATLAAGPLGLIAWERGRVSAGSRLHVVLDMDAQPKLKTQRRHELFADGRAMRPQVEGTVALGQLDEDDALFRGVTNGEWLTTIPVEVTMPLLERGRDRYRIYCSPCHGLAGYGDGIMTVLARELRQESWTPPTSFHSADLRQQPVGSLFNTITNGVRKMPAYGSQVPVHDRWAIVAYVRAIQRSQNARLEDVPPERRGGLR